MFQDVVGAKVFLLVGPFDYSTAVVSSLKAGFRGKFFISQGTDDNFFRCSGSIINNLQTYPCRIYFVLDIIATIFLYLQEDVSLGRVLFVVMLDW